MTWTDNTSNHRTYKIQSDTEEGLTEDLLTLFSDIKGDEFTDNRQILIYIDATNRNLFISGFNYETNEVFDEKGIFVQLTEFWEENQNAYDFDEIAISALKKAYKKSDKTIFKSNYEIFYKTEDESDSKRL